MKSLFGQWDFLHASSSLPVYHGWETPLPDQTFAPSISTLSGWKISFYPLPFPIFDLVHVQLIAHLLVSVQMNSCLPKQLLPGNWITDEENSCNLNSRLLINICYRSIFSMYMHHSPKFMSFIIPGGWAIFLLNSDKVRFGMAFQNSLFQFWSIFQQLLLGISALRVWGILSSFLCLIIYFQL